MAASRWYLGFWSLVALDAVVVTWWVGLRWIHHPGTVSAVSSVIVAVAAVATFIVVVRTAATAVSALDDAKKTRYGQLVTDLTRRWDEAHLVRSQEFYSEIGPTGIIELADQVNTPKARKDAFTTEEAEQYQRNVEDFKTLLAFPDLLDMIGVLVEEGMIAPDIVYKLWGPRIAVAWRTWNTRVESLQTTPVGSLRALWGRPATYRYFQSLGEKMSEIEASELAGTSS